jgi:hypothetical protein
MYNFAFKLLLCALLSLLLSVGWSQVTRKIITDPKVSLRCKEMLKNRNEKIQLKQKLKGLIKRTNRIIKRNNKARLSALQSIRRTNRKVKQEHYLTVLRIKSLEENIIRKGCPGLLLE